MALVAKDKEIMKDVSCDKEDVSEAPIKNAGEGQTGSWKGQMQRRN